MGTNVLMIAKNKMLSKYIVMGLKVQWNTVHYSEVKKPCAVLCSTVQWRTVQYNALKHSSVQASTVKGSTVETVKYKKL